MTHLLYTDHLQLRPSHIDDVDLLHDLCVEAEMRRFLFDDRLVSHEEVRSFIDASVENFANDGYGLWLFFLPESETIAGFAGLLDASQSAPSLIFGTRTQLWGRGYATEAASAILRYAFDVLGMKRIVADVDEPNLASIRVLELLGMSQTRKAIINGRPLLYYEIEAPDQER